MAYGADVVCWTLARDFRSMQRLALIALLCLMFCVPFVLMATGYEAAPVQLPVLRVGIGHTTLWATKSLFMVFRVPLMNLLHGLMSAVMLSRASDFRDEIRRDSYSKIFLTLLITVALKSNLEAMEFVSVLSPALHPYEAWLGYATLTCVLTGLALAAIGGRGVKLPWPELRLTIRDKVLLVGLFGGYLAIVIGSLGQAHPLAGVNG